MGRRKKSGHYERVTNVTNVAPVTVPVISNEEAKPIPFVPNFQNSYAQACGFAQGQGGYMGYLPGGGFPGTGSSPQPVSDAATLFSNLRWYMVSNDRQLLNQMFVELGLIQTLVCVPVDDGLRGGVLLKSQQLSEEEINELNQSMDRDDDITTCGWAAKWNRLFGGAGILILVGDQDPEEPLDINAIGPDTDLEFRAVDMWELYWDKQNTEGYDFQTQEDDFETYSYYGEKIHKTRVMRMKGIKAPSFVRPRLRGWGVSVVESLVRSMNQYLKAVDLGFEVLDEFKLDVYKIKNLVNTLLSPTGTAKVKEQIQIMNWQKNYQNAVVMDSEDDYDHKQLSFAGLAECQAGIRMQVASDLRMPITKLFGTSVAGGFATDQNDMENYNAMVESEVRNKLKYDILRICEIKCQKLFGFIPDDLSLEFKPLRELSAVDQETVKTQKFARLFQAQQGGMISPKDFAEAANKGDLFDVEIDATGLSVTVDDIDGNDDITEKGPDQKKNVDKGDPGADRLDTEKVGVSVDTFDPDDRTQPHKVKSTKNAIKRFMNEMRRE